MTEKGNPPSKRKQRPSNDIDEETHAKHLEVVQKRFREQYQSGDKLALLDCIRWCHRYSVPAPHWAIAVLSKASGYYLSGVSDNFHDALFGARKDTGRHSNPATARRESHQLLYDIVTALRNHGLKGDRLYERAQELLQQLHLTADMGLKFRKKKLSKVPKVDTIKRRFEQMKRDGARPSGLAHLMPMIVDLGDPPRRGK